MEKFEIVHHTTAMVTQIKYNDDNSKQELWVDTVDIEELIKLLSEKVS